MALPSYIPTRDEIDAERLLRQSARKSFMSFVVATHVNYNPQPFHRYVAARMQAWAEFRSPFMQIVLPPRRGKSELGSRRLPAWNLGRDPDEQVLLTANTADLAQSFAVDVRRIVMEDRYKTIFPDTRVPEKGNRGTRGELERMSEWEILGRRGRVRAAGTGTAIVGKGYRRMHIDDPFAGSEAVHSPRNRDKVWSWYHDEVLTRGEFPFTVMLCNTRWHRDDLAGRLQREEGVIEDGGKWEVIRFPEVQDNKPRPYDDREVGDVLWPTWFMAPWEYLPGTEPPDVSWMPAIDEPIEVTLEQLCARALLNFENYKGDRDAVYQGDPVAEGGNIIKDTWMQRWKQLPSGDGDWIIFCDPKGGSKDPRSSRAVIQLWFRAYSEPANIYLVAQAKGLWDQPETIAAFQQLDKFAPWKWASLKLVEAAADGKSIVASLKALIPGMQEFPVPGAAKAVRYRGAAPYWKAGNVWLPPEELCIDPLTGESWNNDFVQEHKDAPSGINDDQIDTTTMAVYYFFINDREREGEAWDDWNLDAMKSTWGI